MTWFTTLGLGLQPKFKNITKIKYNKKNKMEDKSNTFPHMVVVLRNQKKTFKRFWRWTSIDLPLGLSSGVGGEKIFQKLIL